jgi:hypothetical protein
MNIDEYIHIQGEIIIFTDKYEYGQIKHFYSYSTLNMNINMNYSYLSASPIAQQQPTDQSLNAAP